jgi:hypothetical protein
VKVAVIPKRAIKRGWDVSKFITSYHSYFYMEASECFLLVKDEIMGELSRELHGRSSLDEKIVTS